MGGRDVRAGEVDAERGEGPGVSVRRGGATEPGFTKRRDVVRREREWEKRWKSRMVSGVRGATVPSSESLV